MEGGCPRPGGGDGLHIYPTPLPRLSCNTYNSRMEKGRRGGGNWLGATVFPFFYFFGSRELLGGGKSYKDRFSQTHIYIPVLYVHES